MNKERYNQIIDEAYENYKLVVKRSIDQATKEGILRESNEYSYLSRITFINRIKTDSEFSEKWGLNIEERELNLDERYNYGLNILGFEGLLDFGHSQNDDDKILDFLNYCKVPTKVIQVTYNNETIENYVKKL